MTMQRSTKNGLLDMIPQRSRESLQDVDNDNDENNLEDSFVGISLAARAGHQLGSLQCALDDDDGEKLY
jgi:hypothetical protein